MSYETLQGFSKRLAPDTTPEAPAFFYDSGPVWSGFDTEFGLHELELALSLARDTAPGVDQVKSSMLVNLPPEAKTTLLDLYNEAFNDSKVPSCWNLVRVIGLKKPGKDAKQPESWRPLCMLSCVRKVYERMLLNRLEYWAETNGILSENQFAFRKGRSTMDCLTVLLNKIYTAFECKKIVVVVFLDVEGAFDNVNILKLCWKMCLSGVSAKLVNAIYALVSRRRLLFVDDDGNSFERSGYKGLPQGAPTSPFLYNLYTADLRNVVSPDISVIEFADDVLLCVEDRSEENAVRSIKVIKK